VGMGWNPNGTHWDSLGYFWKFARNPRSPLGFHWEGWLSDKYCNNPYIEDNLPLKSVLFDQLVLICMDKISSEEEAKDLLQVMIAIEIVWSWTDAECVLMFSTDD
jgi:hypothetical protein